MDCVGGDSELVKECVANKTSVKENATITETVPVNVSVVPVDADNSINDEWKKETFKTGACPDQICGGASDPDKDGLSNNDEFRYKTDPKKQDTDGDGKTDGEEVAAGTDPLKSSAKGEVDTVVYESPKTAGTIKGEIYKVADVEMITLENGTKQMQISGRGPSLSYVTVYIYSGDPIIVTVKTDSNGDWTYTVDKKLDDGKHEVYVAVTNNSGAIRAKSEPLPFIKTAQAVKVAQASENKVVAPAAESSISLKKIFYVFAGGFAAVTLAFILLGAVIKKIASKKEQT
jgi:hypothetical protein